MLARLYVMPISNAAAAEAMAAQSASRTAASSATDRPA
jgi:hypothetical protein